MLLTLNLSEAGSRRERLTQDIPKAKPLLTGMQGRTRWLRTPHHHHHTHTQGMGANVIFLGFSKAWALFKFSKLSFCNLTVNSILRLQRVLLG